MKRFVTLLAALLVGPLAALHAADAPKSEAPAKDRSIPFNRWDTNKDEFLTLEEYKTAQKDGPNLEARYKRFDKDGDDKVSRKEFVTPSAK